jgi:hypothetical protein
MTTSEPPGPGAQGDLPRARASLRVSGHLLDREGFERIVSRLENVTGKVTLNTAGDRRIWLVGNARYWQLRDEAWRERALELERSSATEGAISDSNAESRPGSTVT